MTMRLKIEDQVALEARAARKTSELIDILVKTYTRSGAKWIVLSSPEGLQQVCKVTSTGKCICCGSVASFYTAIYGTLVFHAMFHNLDNVVVEYADAVKLEQMGLSSTTACSTRHAKEVAELANVLKR